MYLNKKQEEENLIKNLMNDKKLLKQILGEEVDRKQYTLIQTISNPVIVQKKMNGKHLLHGQKVDQFFKFEENYSVILEVGIESSIEEIDSHVSKGLRYLFYMARECPNQKIRVVLILPCFDQLNLENIEYANKKFKNAELVPFVYSQNNGGLKLEKMTFDENFFKKTQGSLGDIMNGNYSKLPRSNPKKKAMIVSKVVNTNVKLISSKQATNQAGYKNQTSFENALSEIYGINLIRGHLMTPGGKMLCNSIEQKVLNNFIKKRDADSNYIKNNKLVDVTLLGKKLRSEMQKNKVAASTSNSFIGVKMKKYKVKSERLIRNGHVSGSSILGDYITQDDAYKIIRDAFACNYISQAFSKNLKL